MGCQVCRDFVDGFSQDCEALTQGFFRNGQGRSDFDGLTPCADGGEKEESFVEAGFDDGVGQIVIWLFFAGFDDLQAADQSTTGIMADDIGVAFLNISKTGVENFAQAGGIAG